VLDEDALRAELAEARRERDEIKAAITELAPAQTVCVNVSYYGRPCILPPHGWRQSCKFQAPPEEEGGYEEGGSALRDLLEDCSAGGLVALSAAMRWIEYSLYHSAEMTRQTHHALAIRVAEHSHATAQEEQQKLFNYLEQEVTTPS
jgi:hypothetical protein